MVDGTGEAECGPELCSLAVCVVSLSMIVCVCLLVYVCVFVFQSLWVRWTPTCVYACMCSSVHECEFF